MNRLRPLLDSELTEVEALAKRMGTPLDVCPTCGSKEQAIAPGIVDRMNGSYKLGGEQHRCDCDVQIQLRKHYLLANIGDQYMRLDWMRDYDSDDATRDAVNQYVENWPNFKINGMGIEFASPKLGVGKTFAATSVGKELVKRYDERVFFIQFTDVLSLYEQDEAARRRAEARLRDTTVLILDEVKAGTSEKSRNYFAEEFEQLIRHRQNWNLVTIMTTNLTAGELMDIYPRPYSLLSAKQVRVAMGGDDVRISRIAQDNWELALNGERRPIS